MRIRVMANSYVQQRHRQGSYSVMSNQLNLIFGRSCKHMYSAAPIFWEHTALFRKDPQNIDRLLTAERDRGAVAKAIVVEFVGLSSNVDGDLWRVRTQRDYM